MTLRSWGVLAVCGLAAGCGPTDREAATGVLIAAPFVHILTVAALKLLAHLWGRIRGGHADFAPALTAAGALLICPVLALFVGGNAETTAFAFWLWGTSHLAIVLVTWRIWLQIDPSRAFTWASIPPLALAIVPAMIMLSSTGKDWMGYVLYVWVFPGYMGIVPAVFLTGLLIEAAVRVRKLRR